MTKKVTAEEIKRWENIIVSLHHTVTGYKNDLRSPGTLEHTIFEALRNEEHHYNTKEKIGAYFLHEIAVKHPFWDGNKRTALIVALYLMGLNVSEHFPKDWSDTTNILVKFMLDVAQEKYNYKETLEKIIEIFKKDGDNK